MLGLSMMLGCVLHLVVRSCPTLCDPMDYSPPASSVHGDSPDENTGVGCHTLHQGIFPTQEWNWGLLLCRRVLYQLSHQGSQWYSTLQWPRTACRCRLLPTRDVTFPLAWATVPQSCLRSWTCILKSTRTRSRPTWPVHGGRIQSAGTKVMERTSGNRKLLPQLESCFLPFQETVKHALVLLWRSQREGERWNRGRNPGDRGLLLLGEGGQLGAGPELGLGSPGQQGPRKAVPGLFQACLSFSKNFHFCRCS